MPTLTPEQASVVDAVASGESGLFVDAVAGSGKTTTLVAAAAKAPPGSLAIAFNRKNREDFKARMPEHIECHTFNSLGHKVLCSALKGRVSLDNFKLGDALKAWLRENQSDEIGFDLFAGSLKVLQLAKASGYVPRGIEGARTLIQPEEFYASAAGAVDDEFLPQSVIDFLLREDITHSISNRVIDYSDQLYLPLIFRLPIPRFPMLLPDEAQDFSPLQQTWLEHLFGGRMAAVGDPFQAIYGWRGADCQSVKTLTERFALRPLGLTYCFRCPTAVIKAAQEFVPHIRAPEGYPEGEILHQESAPMGALVSGDVVLCRNNAPLFSLALRLILLGVRPNVLGSGDLARGLANFPKTKLKLKETDPTDLLLAKLESWLSTEITRTRDLKKQDRQRDRAECVRIFAAGQKTVKEYSANVERTLKEGMGTVILSTVHKFKGLEAPRVWILQPDLLQPWRREQDPDNIQQALNLHYVAITRCGSNDASERASARLTYVNSFEED